MTQYSQIEIINQVIEEIIAELPLKDKVSIANLEENDIELLQHVFDVYVRGKIGNDFEDDEAADIMNELWERLRDSHRLRAV